MDFRQFRYFVTAAEELHFARAAEKLGIAQPALSQQIKALEEQLGTRLFLRTKRRVELTETGAAFLQEAQNTLAQAEKAVRVAQNMARGEAGQIDIGLVGSVMYESRFTLQLKAYSKEHPGVRISLHEMPILPQIDAVRSQHLDIAIVRDPIPETALVDVELDDAHWAPLRFMRQDSARTGVTPTLRRLQTVGGFDVKELYRLYPGKPVKMMAWLAGLPKPVGCV